MWPTPRSVKIAESLVASNVLGDALPSVTSFQREVRNICGSNMRTDFVMSHEDGTRSVMEVKTVVDTDVSETTAREIQKEYEEAVQREKELVNAKSPPSRKGKKKKATKKSPKSKLRKPVVFPSKRHPYVRAGIFPWGSCKQIGPDGEKVVSARAIKHVDELARIASGDIKDENNDELGAAVLFVVGRGDAELFRPNVDGCASFARHLAAAKDAVSACWRTVLCGVREDLGEPSGVVNFRSRCKLFLFLPSKKATRFKVDHTSDKRIEILA